MAGNFARRRLGRHHRFGLVMGARGGGKQQIEIGDRRLDGVEQLGTLQDVIGPAAARCAAMLGQPSRG